MTIIKPATQKRLQQFKNSYAWTVPYLIILFIFFAILKVIIP